MCVYICVYIYMSIIYVIYITWNIYIYIYEDIFMSSFILSNLSMAIIYAKEDIFYIQKLFCKTKNQGKFNSEYLTQYILYF